MKTYKEFINEAKVIRRNLPINTTYKLIDSYYTGGVIDNPDYCENCGKVIANVGILQNTEGEKFHVGMDCAATLSGIKNSDEYEETMNNFQAALAVRTKIKNAKKKYPNGVLTANNSHTGNVNISFSEKGDWQTVFSTTQPYKFIKKYLPEIAELISNKDKNEFVPKYKDSDDFGFDFSKITQPRLRQNDYSFKIDNYDIEIKDMQSTATSGQVNDHIDIYINQNGKNLYHNSTYMPRDVKNYIVWGINKIEFEKFNN
jgi:protein-arginine kinase activator protein McsA